MIEYFKNLDTDLLLFINHLNNPVLDFIFFWISNKWIWIPFYLFLAYRIYHSEQSHFLLILFFIALAIVLSDQISSTFIKDFTKRLRPCHNPLLSSKIHLVNNYCGGLYGFVSSHAANVFTLSSFISVAFSHTNKKLLMVIWLWAIVVSFSRIYLGVHYPGDVIGGALVGITIGFLLGKLCSKAIHNPENQKSSF